ncbi:MAG: hypothetical protein KAS32_27275 [Candidatus Peribacteraceae bacterium]|nr:hypothetical protein [Candidatus Peribacteraceae bacterium]
MAADKVGIKAGITAKLEKRDDKGEVLKTTFFFPDLDVSVEAENREEARGLAEAKAKKKE